MSGDIKRGIQKDVREKRGFYIYIDELVKLNPLPRPLLRRWRRWRDRSIYSIKYNDDEG